MLAPNVKIFCYSHPSFETDKGTLSVCPTLQSAAGRLTLNGSLGSDIPLTVHYSNGLQFPVLFSHYRNDNKLSLKDAKYIIEELQADVLAVLRSVPESLRPTLECKLGIRNTIDLTRTIRGVQPNRFWMLTSTEYTQNEERLKTRKDEY